MPDLGQVPEIDVPSYLPDLPGIADDLTYSADLGPGIAPSAPGAIPELPTFHTGVAEPFQPGELGPGLELGQESRAEPLPKYSHFLTLFPDLENGVLLAPPPPPPPPPPALTAPVSPPPPPFFPEMVSSAGQVAREDDTGSMAHSGRGISSGGWCCWSSRTAPPDFQCL